MNSPAVSPMWNIKKMDTDRFAKELTKGAEMVGKARKEIDPGKDLDERVLVKGFITCTTDTILIACKARLLSLGLLFIGGIQCTGEFRKSQICGVDAPGCEISHREQLVVLRGMPDSLRTSYEERTTTRHQP